jgi:large subunit ribosomal protein L7/L12
MENQNQKRQLMTIPDEKTTHVEKTTRIEKAQRRVKDLEEKLKQAKALKQKAEARVKAAESKIKRRDETRRKILVGAMILEEMEKNDATKTSVMSALKKFLTRQDDRALFHLAENENTAS